MYHYLSFFVQLGVYIIIMYISTIQLSQDDIRVQGLHTRTVVSVLQVFVLLVFFMLHSIFKFLVSLLKKDKQTFVLVDFVSQAQDELASESPGRKELLRDLNALESRDPKDMPDMGHVGHVGHHEHKEDSNEDAESQRQGHNNTSSATTNHDPENKSVNMTNFLMEDEHLSTHTMDSNTSDLGIDVKSSIIFENSNKLDLYVIYILALGGILWNTFLSFNFATANTSTSFVTGVAAGFCMHNMLIYCHDMHSCVVLCWVLVYFILYTSIITMSWKTMSEVQGDDLMIYAMYISAFVSGMFWTTFGGEVGFKAINYTSQHGIYYDTRRAIPMTIMIMCLNGLCVAPDTRIMVWDYISSMSRLATLHLLCIEPLLKFLSMYMMIITLERKRAVDFVTSIIVVQAIHVVMQTRNKEYEGHNVGLMISSASLLGMHITFVIRHNLQNNRQSTTSAA